MYAYSTVICINLRIKQDFSDLSKRIIYAKEYKCIVQQIYSLIRSCKLCRELQFDENVFWGVFDTRYKNNIDEIVTLVKQLHGMLKVLFFLLSKKGFPLFEWGIGVDYNRILLFDVDMNSLKPMFLGPVLQNAIKLAKCGNQNYFDNPIMISGTFYSNMNVENQKMFCWNTEHNCYHGSIVDATMDKWLKRKKV